jgi:hypothetical protein
MAARRRKNPSAEAATQFHHEEHEEHEVKKNMSFLFSVLFVPFVVKESSQK